MNYVEVEKMSVSVSKLVLFELMFVRCRRLFNLKLEVSSCSCWLDVVWMSSWVVEGVAEAMRSARSADG